MVVSLQNVDTFTTRWIPKVRTKFSLINENGQISLPSHFLPSIPKQYGWVGVANRRQDLNEF